jgi:ketosteroid isomerase-like protein
MKTLAIFSGVVFLLLSCSDSNEDTSVREVLGIQTSSWNRGDIEGFMNTYWKSDSLMFIGKNGVVLGWKQTLENYKKGYPDTIAMGKLSFHIIQVRPLSEKYYFVAGKWALQRTAGDLSGHFTLLMEKIDGEWKIVADHSP